MKIAIFILFSIFSIMSIDSLSSQQVKKEGNYIYIDCSNMPYKARRSSLPTADHNEKSMDNRVPNRLAIAPADASTRELTQGNAKTACANYDGPNGGETGLWRVPTQREAIRICTFQTKLEQTPGFTPFSKKDNDTAFFWTSTKSSETTTNYWVISFEMNATRNEPSTYTNYVRCVRDY